MCVFDTLVLSICRTLIHFFYFLFLKIILIRLKFSFLSTMLLCVEKCVKKKKKTLFFLNTVFWTLLKSQSNRKDDKEQPEWGQAQSSEDFSQANSSLIYNIVFEFQELSNRHWDTLIHSALFQRKCQVHRHFKPALVLWLEINNTAWY